MQSSSNLKSHGSIILNKERNGETSVCLNEATEVEAGLRRKRRRWWHFEHRLVMVTSALTRIDLKYKVYQVEKI